MNIENDVFKRSRVNFDKLETYGFKKINNNYLYSKVFFNGEFKASITVNKEGVLFGKVIDLNTNEEYENIRIEKFDGSFVNSVREEYKSILIDIKKNCFNEFLFKSDQANEIVKYMINKYGSGPEFLWKKTPFACIFRNKSNNKWYAIIMNIDKSKLTNETGEVEIINLKLDGSTINNLLEYNGYYRAYHMNKKSWITVVLDGTVLTNDIINLIDESYINVNK